MAINSTLAIALKLMADTKSASAAMSKFTDATSKKLKGLENRVGNWGSKANGNLKTGLAILAPLGLAIKMATDLEDNIADVAKAANVDFGSKEFKALEQGAMSVGAELGRSATEVSGLYAALAQGGVPVAKLKEIATVAGKVGVAFGVTAGEAGKGFMLIQNAMALTDKDTITVLDAMNAATNKYGGQASALLEFMASGAASVAKTLKISGVSMQAFGNAFQVVGKSASESATFMERFQMMVLRNAKASEIFNKAGGGTKGMLAILDKAKASGNATKFLDTMGLGAYSAAWGGLVDNMETAKGLKAQLGFLNQKTNVEGSSDAEFRNRQKTTSEQFNKMKVSAYNMAITLGSKLLPIINNLMKSLKPLIERFTKWIGENPKLY